MKAAFEIEAVDHIEIATRDISASEQLFHRLGFETLTSRTLSERALQSKLLGQNNLYIILSQSQDPNDPIAKFVTAHGEGVFAVTLRTSDAVSALEYVHAKGAKVTAPPKMIQKEYGKITIATIGSVGSTQVHFLTREGQLFHEGFDYALKPAHPGYGLNSFDHFSMVVPKGELTQYKSFLAEVLGLEEVKYGTSSPNKIYLKYKNFHIVLNEPDSSTPELAKFVEGHHGAGFDHIAFGTDNILNTLKHIQKANVTFRKADPAFYESLALERPDLKETLPSLQQYNVAVHGTPDSQILQAATLFLNGFWYFEFVERHNFKWLGTEAQKVLKA